MSVLYVSSLSSCPPYMYELYPGGCTYSSDLSQSDTHPAPPPPPPPLVPTPPGWLMAPYCPPPRYSSSVSLASSSSSMMPHFSMLVSSMSAQACFSPDAKSPGEKVTRVLSLYGRLHAPFNVQYPKTYHRKSHLRNEPGRLLGRHPATPLVSEKP